VDEDVLGWLQDDQPFVGRRQSGFRITELLDLSETMREMVVEITRREPVRLAELAEVLDRNPVEIEIQASQLVAQGWLDVEEGPAGEWLYRVRIASNQGRLLPPGIWQVLDDRWQVPILRLFTDAVREEFSSRFQLSRHKSGMVLFEAGSWGERMYIVDRGRVALTVCNDVGESFLVRMASAGDVLGEMAVLMGERRPYTARIEEDAYIWSLSKSDLDGLLAQYPLVGVQVRQELSRCLRRGTGAADAVHLYNPVVAVGEGSADLARQLANQISGQVVLVDLVGKRPEPVPNLVYLDGRGMYSKAVARAVQEHIDQGTWVIIAVLPQMSDQLIRITGVASVIVDLTGGGAPWLSAAARQYWSVPSSTPLKMARLARKLVGRTTGLALSGGAARALAHVGVLDVLHDAGIEIDLIAGCGYGALWGVLYAAEWSPKQIIDLAHDLAKLRPFGTRLRWRALPQAGLFDARRVRTWIRDLLGDKRFSDLETPCYLATSDLQTGEVVWLTEGSVADALLACVAVPGLVTPVQVQGRTLVDAILHNPLPVDVLASEKADIVLASSVIPVPTRSEEGRPSDGQRQDLVTSWLGICGGVAHEQSLARLGFVDLVLFPDVGEFAETAFEQASLLIERGRQAAREALPRLRKLRSERRDPVGNDLDRG
jgi:NTE family protein